MGKAAWYSDTRALYILRPIPVYVHVGCPWSMTLRVSEASDQYTTVIAPEVSGLVWCSPCASGPCFSLALVPSALLSVSVKSKHAHVNTRSTTQHHGGVLDRNDEM
jgi:hypothetical protein